MKIKDRYLKYKQVIWNFMLTQNYIERERQSHSQINKKIISSNFVHTNGSLYEDSLISL